MTGAGQASFLFSLPAYENLQMGSRPPETYWSLARSEVSLARHISTHLTAGADNFQGGFYHWTTSLSKVYFWYLTQDCCFQSTGLTPRDPWTHSIWATTNIKQFGHFWGPPLIAVHMSTALNRGSLITFNLSTALFVDKPQAQLISTSRVFFYKGI